MHVLYGNVDVDIHSSSHVYCISHVCSWFIVCNADDLYCRIKETIKYSVFCIRLSVGYTMTCFEPAIMETKNDEQSRQRELIKRYISSLQTQKNLIILAKYTISIMVYRFCTVRSFHGHTDTYRFLFKPRYTDIPVYRTTPSSHLSPLYHV